MNFESSAKLTNMGDTAAERLGHMSLNVEKSADEVCVNDQGDFDKMRAEEEVFCKEMDTALVVTSEEHGEKNHGRGKLVVSSQKVVWNHSSSELSVVVEYPNLTMHAICTDVSYSDKPCIYCQVQTADGEGMDELRIVPADEEAVKTIFAALSKGTALHPDPYEEEGDSLFAGMGFEPAVVDEAQALSHWDSLLEEPGQFDDATS